MNQYSNPLKQFFRQPSIYIRLPSGGNFWKQEALETPVNNEYPVLPMTAIDEITYRTPDALFNGQAVVSVIESCMPNIKDAWETPIVDLDTILVAIRIASFGHELSVETRCPKCEHEAEYGIDLRQVLDRMGTLDYSKTVHTGEMEIFFRPLTYRQTTENSLKQFEEQKILNILPNTDIPESEKLDRLSEAVKKLTELTIDALSECILMIRTANAQVTETEFIREFLTNAPSATFNQIRDHIVALRESNELKPLNIRCSSCENNYDQPITLDQSFFFGDAS